MEHIRSRVGNVTLYRKWGWLWTLFEVFLSLWCQITIKGKFFWWRFPIHPSAIILCHFTNSHCYSECCGSCFWTEGGISQMWGDFGHFISEYQVINNNTLCRKYSLSWVQFKFFRLPDTFTLQICPICGKNVIIASLRREKKPKFSTFSALISPFTSPKNCLILPTFPNQIRKVTLDIPELSSEG